MSHRISKEGRSRMSGSVAKCKACVRCRSRKIKCDGKQPSCSTCDSHGDPCVYGEDQRQASRLKKVNIDPINERLARIENSLMSLSDKLSSRDVSETGSLACERSEVSRAELHLGSVTSARPSKAVPRIEENEGVGITRRPDSEDGTPHGEFSSPQYEEAPSSQLETRRPLGILFMVEDMGSVSAHGPSSAFHFHENSPTMTTPSCTSQLLPSESKSPQYQTDPESIEQIRMHLVASAAIERQQESSRLLQGQCDFDGLDIDMARHLLDIHWNRHHYMFLLSYRPLMMQDLLQDGRYANKLLWNAIFYTSSLQSDRTQKATLGSPNGVSLKDRFYNRFNNLLVDYLDKSSVATVVALLLMGSSLVTSGKQTTGWLYCGLAYRMIIDLGMHLDSKQTQTSRPFDSSAQIMFTQQELEMRRRVYWAAYTIDKFQSLYFGRPASLTVIGAEPPQSFLDTYEELELWTPYIDPLGPDLCTTNLYRPQPAYPVTTFRALLRLAEISYDIIQIFYLPHCSKITLGQATRALNDLRTKLDSWLTNFPSHIQYDPDKDYTLPHHQLTPHTTFHTLQILLHRPFLPEGHLSHLSIENTPFRDICTSSALRIYKIARAYEDAFTFQHAPYLFSYALFSAATVIPRHEDHLEVITFFCKALVILQRGANLGLRKPLVIIRDLMQRAGVDVNSIMATSALNLNLKQQQQQSQQDPDPSRASRQEENLASPTGFPALLSPNDASRILGDLAAQDLWSGAWDDTLDLFQVPANPEDANILYGMFE